MFRNLYYASGILTTISGIFLCWLNLISHVPDLTTFPVTEESRGVKIILAWTKFFNINFTDSRYLSACPKLPCTISNNRSDLEKAAALVFHVRDTHLEDLPKRRSADQRFVFMSHEAPPYTYLDWRRLSHFFNWTMTYRRDSDIFYPYSLIIQRNLTAPQSAQQLSQTQKYIHSKSRSIVWFVSNCQTKSKREAIAHLLARHLSLDIYGHCGNKSVCPNKSDRVCVKNLINEHYRFFLAFENTLCKDYITEKYWGRWEYFSVPIVLKRHIYQDYAPPHSFIAVDDYPSIKAMAAHIKRLERNATEYAEYFHWRQTGYSSSSRDTRGHYIGFCGLCQRLWSEETRPNIYSGTFPETKSYPNIAKWWITGSQCDSGQFAHKYAPKVVVKN